VTAARDALDALDVDAFRRDGWLVVRGALNDDRLGELDAAVRRLERRAVDGEHDGHGLHHFEQTDAGAVLARSEDFVHDDPVLHDFICSGLVVDILGRLFGEPAVLFKEKINYKQPGGGGFAPHQDATAYRFVDHHISCMVPFDPATPASGCLYVAPGFADGQLPTDDRGRIEAATADQLSWRPVPLEPGDLLFFDSYTPHYSDTNTTQRPRRAAYLTYNARSLGDHRDRYYADKRAEFERVGDDFEGERVRISITDDFLGRPVTR
jgi:ectoine hydroxylase-related dioxygenase (phytanoyl-CoA dioxygenase family)